mgnify:FL=1
MLSVPGLTRPATSGDARAAEPSTPRSIKDDAYEVVERLSTMLVDSYVETDEDIGPRVSTFATAGQQIDQLGLQIERLREATVMMKEAHIQLAQISRPTTGSMPSPTDVAAGPAPQASHTMAISRAASEAPPSTPSLQSFAEHQHVLVELTQSLASEYDRSTSIIGQLQGKDAQEPASPPLSPFPLVG